MGELETTTVERALSWVDSETLRRIRTVNADRLDRARLFSACTRLNILTMIAAAGSGHIGSSLSSLDIVTWLHLEVMGKDDRYFSSKGHDVPGLYAILVGLGQLPESSLFQLRRLGGLPGHPDVGTPGIVANTGSLGMGVSKAKGMLAGYRRQGRGGRIFVLTGDGELQEGQMWESLVGAANLALGAITVIVDHNKLQSDTYVTRVSDLGNLEAKFAAFGWSVARCDGHDVAALDDALHARDHRPHVVIADTVKGRGVSFMEHTSMAPDQELYAFHSGAPSTADYDRAVEELKDAVAKLARHLGVEVDIRVSPAPPPVPAPQGHVERLFDAYAEALVSVGRRDERVVAMDADLMLDMGLIPFRDAFPDRFVECGIAEQDMVSQAGGMAHEGLLPFVHSFACFLSSRPNEQIYNVATERGRVIYVGGLAGLLPSGPGHSHQSVRDVATMGSVPGMVVLQPMTGAQVRRAVEMAVNDDTHSWYLRMTSVPVGLPVDLADEPLVMGRGHVVADNGRGLVVMTAGPVMLREALVAAKELPATVVAMPFLNRLDTDWFVRLVAGAGAVVTVDDHYIDGALGTLVATVLAESGMGLTLTRLGLTDVPACGQAEEVLRHHGLHHTDLADRFAGVIGR